jgi:hypothetical protein
MQPRAGNPSIMGARTAPAIWLSLLFLAAAGAVGGAIIASASRSDNAVRSIGPACEAWDDAASAALAPLVADRSPVVEMRLGDALFRLRRARKNCALGWVSLARLDYQALLDGRYGRHP